MQVMGQTSTSMMEVVEATPHSSIVEVIEESGIRTSFLFDPVGGGKTRTTILTEFTQKPGVAGWIEKQLINWVFPGIYAEELENIENYAQTVAISQ